MRFFLIKVECQSLSPMYKSMYKTPIAHENKSLKQIGIHVSIFALYQNFSLFKFQKTIKFSAIFPKPVSLSSPGSEISFNSSSSFVKPLVSSNLTLTCKLQDTAPTGPAIGKRSVPSDYDVINGVEGEMGRDGGMLLFFFQIIKPTYILREILSQ